MSYISDNLIPNEQVLYRTRLHWKIFVPAVLLLLLCISVIVVAIDGGLNPYLSLEPAGRAPRRLCVGLFDVALL